MKEVKFGLIGCGMIGKMHARIINESVNSRLVAACDSTINLSREIGRLCDCNYYIDYHEMLKREDIDAVTVCVPSGLHYEAVVAAAKAGKHVIVEKPIEVTVERADEMIKVCRENNVILSVILQHRFDAAIRELKSLIDRGRFGRLLFGTSRTLWYREPEYYKSSGWRGTWTFDGGGALLNQSIHYIDLLLYIFGEVEAICGSCATLLHKSIETEDIGTAMLKFSCGAIGTIEGTTIAYPGLSSELTIVAEKGVATIKNDKLDFYKHKDGNIPELDKLIDEEIQLTTGVGNADSLDISSHRKQFLDVIGAIRNNCEPGVNGEEGKRSLAVIKTIYESSERKQWICKRI